MSVLPAFLPECDFNPVLQVQLYLNETNGVAEADDLHCIFIGLDDYINALSGLPVLPAVVVAYIEQSAMALYNAGARM